MFIISVLFSVVTVTPSKIKIETIQYRKGLKITVSQWTMSSLIMGLISQTLVWPVILTGHFWMQTFYNIFHIVVA